MRMSRLVSQTLRDVPSEVTVRSHELLSRAGFIQQVAAGIFTYLPLGKRSLTKIEQILRDEMDALGGQEMEMPVVNPASLWEETGRWGEIGAELGRFVDRNGRDMALCMTHEETVTEMIRKQLTSYTQLPLLVYHIQTKWRDDPRPRAGLIRVREFIMKDSYSFDADWEGLDKQYRAHYQSYFNIFRRCGLEPVAVQSDVGMMGGKMAHEFMFVSPVGEDTLVLCDACGYSANRQVAVFRKEAAEKGDEAELEKISTPDVTTIDALAEMLEWPTNRIAKTVQFIATPADGSDPHLVCAVVRGDMEVNETKLTNLVGAREMRPATDDEIEAAGATPGFAAPWGLADTTFVVDDVLEGAIDLVTGSNERDYHYKHANFGRDFADATVADVVAAQEGDACHDCGQPLRTVRAVELGNIFMLGTRYSEAMGAHFMDCEGKKKPVIMGSYGIGTGRLLACVAEQHNGEQGLRWPVTVAPYQVYLVVIKGGDEATGEAANRMYEDLTAAGVEVLFDDRDLSPGVKFTDADLIGLPLRMVIGKRTMKTGSAELKRNDGEDLGTVPLTEAVAKVQAELRSMEDAILQTVSEVPYVVAEE